MVAGTNREERQAQREKANRVTSFGVCAVYMAAYTTCSSTIVRTMHTYTCMKRLHKKTLRLCKKTVGTCSQRQPIAGVTGISAIRHGTYCALASITLYLVCLCAAVEFSTIKNHF